MKKEEKEVGKWDSVFLSAYALASRYIRPQCLPFALSRTRRHERCLLRRLASGGKGRAADLCVLFGAIRIDLPDLGQP